MTTRASDKKLLSEKDRESENDWFEKNQKYLFQWIDIVKARLRNIAIADAESTTSGIQEPVWEGRHPSAGNYSYYKSDNVSHHNISDDLPSLDYLAAVFGLSHFEKSILVLCAGAEIDPEISQMCAGMYSNNNNGRDGLHHDPANPSTASTGNNDSSHSSNNNNNIPFPTFDIAIRIFPNAHWSAFLPSSPLRLFQLVSLPIGSGSGSGRAPILTMPVRIDESILHYILGFRKDLARLQDNTLKPVLFDALLPDSHKDLADRIRNSLTELRYPNQNYDDEDDDNDGNNSENDEEKDGRESPNSSSWHNMLPAAFNSVRQAPTIINLCGEHATDNLLVAKHVCDALGLGLLEQPASLVPDNLIDMRSKILLCVRECRIMHSSLVISWKEDDDDNNRYDDGGGNNIGQQSKLPLIVEYLGLLASKNWDHDDGDYGDKFLIFLSTPKPVSSSLGNSVNSFTLPRSTKDERRKLLAKYLASKYVASSSGLPDEILNLSELELDSLTIQKVSGELLSSSSSSSIESADDGKEQQHQENYDAAKHQKQKQKKQQQQKQRPSSLPYQHYSSSSTIFDLNKQLVRNKISQLAQLVIPKASMDDLVLPDRQKRLLQSIMIHVRQRNKVYREWGFEQKSARGLGIIALFAGESGTGKTMAAEVLANELKRDLYRIDLSTVVNKYIGETEKNLKRIFDAAEGSGAILFFDEADALFGKRSEVKDSHDRYANMEVGYLLQRIESYGGLVILATNFKTSLDSAFARRLRFILDFPFPDSKSRTQIWKRVFPISTPTDGLDYDKLARLSITGGHIRNIAMNAAFIAAENGEPVKMQSIKQAAEDEYHKMGRSLTRSEIGEDW